MGAKAPPVGTDAPHSAEAVAVRAFLEFFSEYSNSTRAKRTADQLGREMKTLLQNPPLRSAFQQPALDPELWTQDSFLSSLCFLKDIGNCSRPLPLLFTIAVQRFLTDLGIHWPVGVFQENPTQPGSGRKPSEKRAVAVLMRQQGKGTSDIAKILIPDVYEKDRKLARDRVRSLLRTKPSRARKNV